MPMIDGHAPVVYISLPDDVYGPLSQGGMDPSSADTLGTEL
jgi:hypothetical protein